MKNSGTYLKVLIIQSWGWQARGLRPGDGRLEGSRTSIQQKGNTPGQSTGVLQHHKERERGNKRGNKWKNEKWKKKRKCNIDNFYFCDFV